MVALKVRTGGSIGAGIITIRLDAYEDLRKLMKYFDSTIPENAVTQELTDIQRIVDQKKLDPKTKEAFMTLKEYIEDERSEAAEAEKQRADSAEQRAESEKQRADSAEQRADSAEQRAEVAEQETVVAREEILRLKEELAKIQSTK